jgi:hypothetical protein
MSDIFASSSVLCVPEQLHIDKFLKTDDLCKGVFETLPYRKRRKTGMCNRPACPVRFKPI